MLSSVSRRAQRSSSRPPAPAGALNPQSAIRNPQLVGPLNPNPKIQNPESPYRWHVEQLLIWNSFITWYCATKSWPFGSLGPGFQATS